MASSPSSKRLRVSSSSTSSSSYTAEYPPETLALVKEIEQECHANIAQLIEEEEEEKEKIRQKYKNKTKIKYHQRSLLLQKVPQFWTIALMNHPNTFLTFDDEEENCLHFLTNLEVEEFKDYRTGYRIKFYFKENHYFENNLLVKEFHTNYNSTEMFSTKIKWRDNMDLTKYDEDRDRDSLHMWTGYPHPRVNFFVWFVDNQPAFYLNINIGRIIKENLWVRPVPHYKLDYLLGCSDGDPYSNDEEEFSSSEDEEEKDLKDIGLYRYEEEEAEEMMQLEYAIEQSKINK